MSDSPTGCFVDSNVWLYALIDSEDVRKSERAREVLASPNLIVSTQVINEVCVNLLRRASIPEAQVRDLVRSFFEKCRVVELTEAVLLRASELRERYSLSYWDGLIVAAALSSGAAALCSEDMQHDLLIDAKLRIENPFLAGNN